MDFFWRCPGSLVSEVDYRICLLLVVWGNNSFTYLISLCSLRARDWTDSSRRLLSVSVVWGLLWRKRLLGGQNVHTYGVEVRFNGVAVFYLFHIWSLV